MPCVEVVDQRGVKQCENGGDDGGRCGVDLSDNGHDADDCERDKSDQDIQQ